MKINLLNTPIQIIQQKFKSPLANQHQGLVDIKSSKIYIDKDLEKTQKYKVILHELIHYIHCSYQIDLTETEVDVFAMAIYDLIKNNPSFISKIHK